MNLALYRIELAELDAIEGEVHPKDQRAGVVGADPRRRLVDRLLEHAHRLFVLAGIE